MTASDGRAMSRGRLVMRRFLRRRSAVAGLVTLCLLFVLAFLGPLITTWDNNSRDFTAFLSPPSSRHWFGTSQTGADLWAQVLRGMQKSLIVGLLAAVVATGLATVVGAAAGYFGGWLDRFLMWGVDLLLVLPAFLVLAVASSWGQGWLMVGLLFALLQWMITGRMLRNMTRSLRRQGYVQAARFMGVPPYRIIVRHLIPAMAPLLIADATVNLASAIIGEAALSYFGFGIQPPDTSLGILIGEGSSSFLTTPWLFLFPALMLVTIVLSANMIGDGLRAALDPQATR